MSVCSVGGYNLISAPVCINIIIIAAQNISVTKEIPVIAV